MTIFEASMWDFPVFSLHVVFTLGKSPRVCSKYSQIDLRRGKSWFNRDRTSYFAHDGQRALKTDTQGELLPLVTLLSQFLAVM